MARQCRKFLANEKKDHDLRKWAIEGLSYLSLDADVKEELCDDQIALAALFDLCKVNYQQRRHVLLFGHFLMRCTVDCVQWELRRALICIQIPK